MKKRKKHLQKSKFLTHLKKKNTDTVGYYVINVHTNSNLINIQDPYYLSYNSENIHERLQVKDFKTMDLKSCQFCGAITEKKAHYCFNCGIKI